jgi:starch synthase
MPKPLTVLHVVSEVAPFSKTGGLADVAAGLPRALRREGVRPMVVTPRYRSIDPVHHALARRLTPLVVPIGDRREEVAVYEGTLPGGVVPCWFLDHPLFDREGLYGDATGDYADNALRFGLLCRAALELAHQTDRWPDVVHGHDWQSGLATAMAQVGVVAGRPTPRTVMTVHNLAFQGLAPRDVVPRLGLPWEVYTPHGGEFYGQLSLLKLGLAYADRIVAVSPRYAREIQTPEHGGGLDGFLRARAARVTGILNGIDTDVWNPSKDAYLAAHFDAQDRAGKGPCKMALLREVGLAPRAHVPVVATISRLTEQKGFDLVKQAGDELARLDAQFVFLVAGEKRYQDALLELARRYPTKIAVRLGYDEALSHRIIAGSDLFLMPSRFEPCGLTQLYALRYGTIPIVRATGGLDDTVIDHDERTRTGSGFKFADYTAQALVSTVRRALAVYKHREAWDDLVARGMLIDSSWAMSAKRYVEVYEQIVGAGGKRAA